MKAYINGIGCVSPQRTWDSKAFSGETTEYNARMIQCLEPEVDPGLDDKYLRRMNRLLRLGWTAAKICLDDAGNVKPDAIVTGSGWGSVQDSEKFLMSIYKNKESLESSRKFVMEYGKENLAQVYTEVRYKKEDSDFFSKKMFRMLSDQGFRLE